MRSCATCSVVQRVVKLQHTHQSTTAHVRCIMQVTRCHLSKVMHTAPARTEKAISQQLDEIRAAPTMTRQQALVDKYGIHPVQSGLAGFFGGDTPLGSFTGVFGVEGMHVFDLGIWVYIVNHTRCATAASCSPCSI